MSKIEEGILHRTVRESGQSRFQDIPYKERMLNADELERLHSRSMIVHLEQLRHFLRLGIDLDVFTRGIALPLEELKDPETWLTPTQVRQVDLNYIHNLPFLKPHYDNVNEGMRFLYEEPVSVKLSFLFLPLSLVLAHLDRANQQFNREQEMTSHKKSRTSYLIFQDPFPFYKELSLGHECRYAEGIMNAVLQLKGWQKIDIRHAICSKKLENLINDYYGNLSLGELERDAEGNAWLNGKKIGERVKFPVDLFVELPQKMKEKAEGTYATQVLVDMYHEGTQILKKGEYYDAAFCVSKLNWSNQNLLKEFMHRLQAVRSFSEKSPSMMPSEQTSEVVKRILNTGISKRNQEEVTDQIDSFIENVSEAKSLLSPEIISENSQTSLPGSSPKHILKPTGDTWVEVIYSESDGNLKCDGHIIASKTQGQILRAILLDYEHFDKLKFTLKELRLHKDIPETLRNSKGLDVTFQRLCQKVNASPHLPLTIEKIGHGSYDMKITAKITYREIN